MNKNLLKTFVLLVFMPFLSFGYTSNEIGDKKNKFASGDPKEIIVAFENLSDKELIELDEAIAKIPNVKNFGYCQKLKLYFFSYDESKYRTEEAVLEAITVHTKKYQPLHKIGTSSDQINQNCKNL